MRAWLASWAFRRLVAPQLRGYLFHDKATGATVVYTPEELALVLAGGRLRRVRRSG